MTSSSAQDGHRPRGSFVKGERELVKLNRVLADATQSLLVR